MKYPHQKPVDPGSMQFSVVIPLYNKGTTVARAIRSVLTQTYQNFEIIVVNDGSTDTGPAIVRSLVDSRVHLIDQENQGVSAARNRGIAEAKHDLIAFLDADDEWLPEFLETILDLYNRYPEAGVFATNYFYCEPNGTRRQPIIRGLPTRPWNGIFVDYFAIAAQSDPPLCSSAVVVKKTAINMVGCFPAGIKSGEDLLTWASLAVRFSIVYTTKIEAVFWIPEKVSSRPGRFDGFEINVGAALLDMFPVVPENMLSSFKAYLQKWHEMKAVTSLLLQRRSDCLRHLCQACRFARPNFKLLIIAVSACFPSRIGIFLFSWIRSRKKALTYSRHIAGEGK